MTMPPQDHFTELWGGGVGGGGGGFGGGARLWLLVGGQTRAWGWAKLFWGFLVGGYWVSLGMWGGFVFPFVGVGVVCLVRVGVVWGVLLFQSVRSAGGVVCGLRMSGGGALVGNKGFGAT